MNTTTQNTTTNRRTIVIFFVLFLLSTLGMFGQTKATAAATQASTAIVKVVNVPLQEVALDSDVDFMSWFMGAKQTQSVKENTIGNNNTIIARKKQILSSGITPNKVLYSTFVKKVISQESATV